MWTAYFFTFIEMDKADAKILLNEVKKISSTVAPKIKDSETGLSN